MKYKIAIFLIFGICLGSCNFFGDKETEDEVIARAFNEYLYKHEIDNILEPGTSYEDSAIIVKRYLDTWVRQQVLLNAARNYLTEEQMNFDKKIEDYLNSLVIFTFEKEYINNNLDTVVSLDEIADYYEQYKDDFKLKDNIVQASYIKLSKDAPDQNTTRNLIRSDDPEDLMQLEEYCVQNAAAYFIDNESWLIFNQLLRNIPLEVSNQEQFLRNNKLVEITDDFYRYFIYINDYKLKESISPLSFEKDNIRNIIINKRKHDLISRYRNELYRSAVKNNSFEVYN